MKRALLAKFRQNKEIKVLLLSTAGKKLVENTTTDYYWGCGTNKTGRNMLGNLLMDVRAILQCENFTILDFFKKKIRTVKIKINVGDSASSSSSSINQEIIKIVKPIETLETHYLNTDKSSWIKLQKLDSTQGITMYDFEELWCNKPNNKLKIIIAGRVIECPRYSKSYLKDYKFSGLNHEADPILPIKVQQLLERCQLHNPELNQSLINWYEHDGYIGKHSDDTKQLLPNSEIFSLSFGPSKRRFIIEPKDKRDNSQLTLQIELEHNTMIIMGGKCQVTHYHSVPKKNLGLFNQKISERRLNVTFRCFK